jgi:stearoyl-CoA desaturase (delta-9 desaturase)
MMNPGRIEPDWGSISLLSAVPFTAMHVGVAVGVFLAPPTWTLASAAFLSYALRLIAVTGGYHRYFSHRGFKTSRPFQFILAMAGTLAMQKGPLWWAAHHRTHHRFSDTEKDIHSSKIYGFWWAYLGWILSRNNDSTDTALIADFWRYPELRFLNRFHLIPPLAVGAFLWLVLGLPVFVWIGLLPIVFGWHALFCSNVLCHVFGSRRFATNEDSRNNPFFAVLVFGEGWHNNHHFYPTSARQGFYWWEIDVTYYVILFLKKCGLVWDVAGVPARVLAAVRSDSGLRSPIAR